MSSNSFPIVKLTTAEYDALRLIDAAGTPAPKRRTTRRTTVSFGRHSGGRATKYQIPE